MEKGEQADQDFSSNSCMRKEILRMLRRNPFQISFAGLPPAVEAEFQHGHSEDLCSDGTPFDSSRRRCTEGQMRPVQQGTCAARTAAPVGATPLHTTADNCMSLQITG